MILVDASILIDYIRNPDPAVRAVLERPDVAVCGVTRAEMLHGVRTPAEEATITAMLDAFVQLPTPEVVWQELGLNLARLRRAGITVPFQDVLLASVAVHHGAELWSSDGHFPLMTSTLPTLRLFVRPPTPPAGPVAPPLPPIP